MSPHVHRALLTVTFLLLVTNLAELASWSLFGVRSGAPAAFWRNVLLPGFGWGFVASGLALCAAVSRPRWLVVVGVVAGPLLLLASLLAEGSTAPAGWPGEVVRVVRMGLLVVLTGLCVVQSATLWRERRGSGAPS